MNKSIVEVTFKVRKTYTNGQLINIVLFCFFDQVHAETRLGEEIRVSGNVPALGCDIPERAVALVTSSADFPIWASKEGFNIYTIFQQFHV